jgi:hypothetical protein
MGDGDGSVGGLYPVTWISLTPLCEAIPPFTCSGAAGGSPHTKGCVVLAREG